MLFIIFLLVSLQSSGQVWYPVVMQFHLAGIKKEKNLDDYRFGYIDDGNSLHESMAFDIAEKLFLFKCGSKEAEACIVIEKKGKFMVIRVDRSWFEVMRIKFKPGYFRVEGKKLIADDNPKPDLELTVELNIETIPKNDS